MSLSTKALWRRLFVSVALGAVSLAPLGGAALAQAQQAAPATPAEPAAPVSPETVLATVNGQTITEGDLAFAAEDLQQELSQVPADKHRAFLTSILIDMKIMADAARKADMANTETFKRRQTYLEDRSLRRAYFQEKISPTITDEQAKAAYDKAMEGFTAQEEVHARHILVTDEELIKKIKAEIDGGKPFEVAAMENSIDGSAQNGGDLGYFRKGQMVPEFETAAFALEAGQVSEPVKSQFGWHLIKVEDKRMSAPPPFEQVKAQFQQQALIEAFNTQLKDLKAGASIEFKDEGIAQELEQQDAAQ